MASFADNFRQAFGQQPFTKYDPIGERRWNNANMQGLNQEAERQASLTPENKAEISKNKNMAAHNNTLFVDNDPTKNAGWRGLEEDVLPFKDFGVFQNSNKLYEILDDYDAEKDWNGKMNVIENSWKIFPVASRGVTNWLLNLEDLTKKAMNAKGEERQTAKDVSNVMRDITKSVYDSFISKS